MNRPTAGGSALQTESDQTRRWILLDAALSVGDPGDKNRPWPPALANACKSMPNLVQIYIGKRLAARRNSIFEQLQQKDR